MGLKAEGLPIDEQGLLPEALDAACRSGSPKALYCLPVLQNPTNVTMPAARREAIARVALAHDLPVIEDDVYGLLPEEAPPALCSFLAGPGFLRHLALQDGDAGASGGLSGRAGLGG